MSRRPIRLARRCAAVLAAPLVAVTLAVVPATSSAPAPAARATAHPAGFSGPAVVLGTYSDVEGYDLGTDSAGTSYLAWISFTPTTLREVHLCVLPPGATACAGGQRTIDAAGPASAADLQVVVTGPGAATLVWFVDDVGTGHLAYATYANGVLSGANLGGSLPDDGELLDVERGPGGAIWSLSSSPDTSNQVVVHTTLFDAPQVVTTPITGVDARLAFQGTTPVMAVVPSGRITDPVRYSTRSGTSWSAFRRVAGTWNIGTGFGLVAAAGAVRLVASESNARYRPVISRFSRGAFGTPRLTGDGAACTPTGHDLVTDASRRVADVSYACSKLRVANLPDAAHAGTITLPSGGTISGGDPQITTRRDGTGWVAWGIVSSTSDGVLFRVRPIRLPAASVSRVGRGAPGSVTVTGPRSCLPAVTTGVAARARAARPWRLLGTTLRLGSRAVSGRIDGATLRSGQTYRLTAVARFRRPGQTRSLTVTLPFRVC